MKTDPPDVHHHRSSSALAKPARAGLPAQEASRGPATRQTCRSFGAPVVDGDEGARKTTSGDLHCGALRPPSALVAPASTGPTSPRCTHATTVPATASGRRRWTEPA